MPKNTKPHYENNPFIVATTGLALMFNSALGIAIIFTVFSLFSYYGGGSDKESNSQTIGNQLSSWVQGWSATDWLLLISSALVIGLAIAMILALFSGVASYTSAQLAKGNKVSISNAFREAFDKLWSYLWLQILISMKLFLWTLLFIIPGIYMSIRYSLAGVAFYDDEKNLRGNSAIKESLRLTKGAWITTFASTSLFNLITLSIISNVVTPGVNAVLYRQFDAHEKKPSAHWLSYATLVFLVGIGVLALAVIYSVRYALIDQLF